MNVDSREGREEEKPMIKVEFAGILVLVSLLIPFLANAEEQKGWPQFMGPNRNGLIHNSTKLLDKWPEGGLKPLWRSTELPHAHYCGIGNPVVADGKVFTFANVTIPADGVYPFVDFLKSEGYVAGMPDELSLRIDKAASSEERKKLKSSKDIEAYIKRFIDKLEPEQQKKYGEAVKIRLATVRGGRFSTATLKKAAALEKTEVKTYNQFLGIVAKKVIRLHHKSYSGRVKSFASKLYNEKGRYSDQLICLDASTGKQLWEQSLPGVYRNWGKFFACSGTPAVGDGLVYYRGSAGLYCLDIAQQGKVVWQVKAPPGNNSPILHNGVLYCAHPTLTAYEPRTGKVLWQQPKLKHTNQTPSPWVHQGKSYLIFISNGRANGVDAKDGSILWSVKQRGLGSNGVAVSGDIMVARSDPGGSGGMAYKLSLEKATPLWDKIAGKGDHGGASSIIYNDHVYFGGCCYGSNGMVDVINLKSGKMTLKGPKGKAAGTIPIIADNKIIYTDGGYKGGGWITLCKATPAKYELIGRTKGGPGLVGCSSPALAGGLLYYRTAKAIVCYDLRQK